MRINMRQFILAIYSVFISICVLSESCFIEYDAWHFILTALRYTTVIVMLLLTVKKNNLKLTRLQMGVLALIVILSCINMYTTGGGTMPLLVIVTILLVYSYNIDFLSLVRSTINALAGTSIFIVLMSLLGLIEDRVGARYTNSFFISFLNRTWIRHSLGFLVQNQLPSIILFIYIYRIIYKKSRMTILEHLLFCILNFILLFICGSRMNFLMFFIVFISYLFANWRSKRNRKKARKKEPKTFLWILYPVCFIITIFMTIKYNQNIYEWLFLNNLLMNRIVMAHTVYSRYGFSLFGISEKSITSLKIAGINSDSVTLDNGYINSMMLNGAIFTIVVLLIWTWLTAKAEKEKHFHLTFVLAILSVVNLIDAHLFSYKLIPLMALSLGGLSDNEQ